MASGLDVTWNVVAEALQKAHATSAVMPAYVALVVGPATMRLAPMHAGPEAPVRQAVHRLLELTHGRDGQALALARQLHAVWRTDPALPHMDAYTAEIATVLELGPTSSHPSVGRTGSHLPPRFACWR